MFNKKYIIIVLIISFCASKIELTAQLLGKPRADSLLKELNAHIDEDTIRCKILLRLATVNMSIDPEQNLKYILEAQKIAKAKKYRQGDAVVAKLFGDYYYSKSDFNNSLEHYFTSLKIQEELANHREKANLYLSLSQVYQSRFQYIKALEYLYKAINIYESLNYIGGLANAYNSLSILFNIQEDRNKALEYSYKALQYFKETNNKVGTVTVLNNIGNIYIKEKKYYEALDFYQQYLNLSKEIGDIIKTAKANCNIGNVYEELENYPKAIDYYQASLKQSIETDYTYGIALNYTNLGGVEYLSYKKKYKDNTQKLYSALVYTLKADSISKTAYLGKTKLLIDSLLYNIYRDLNNWEKAFYYNYEFNNLKDSVFSEENKMQIALLNDKLESSLKQKELELAENSTELNKLILNYAIVSMFLMAAIAVTYFVFYRRKSVENKKLDEKNKIIENANQLLQEKNLLIAEATFKLESINANLKSKEKELVETNFTKDKLYSIIVNDLKLSGDVIKESFRKLKKLVEINSIEDINKEIELVFINANSTIEMLDNILFWANFNMKKIDFHPFFNSINEIVAHNIKNFQPIATPKEIDIQIYINEIFFVYCDPNYIDTVFRNILNFLIKKCNLRGVISINIKHAIELDSKQVLEVSFESSSLDLSENQLQNLFSIEMLEHKYYPNGAVSSELGLLLSKSFIDAHHGRIWAEKSLGSGAKITFTLPTNINEKL